MVQINCVVYLVFQVHINVLLLQQFEHRVCLSFLLRHQQRGLITLQYISIKEILVQIDD